jgi:transcription-repair coupling factor (superfamily II helicase)
MMIIHFVGNQDSSYYSSPVFRSVLAYIQSQGRRFRLKEENGKLRLSTSPVSSVSMGMDVLNKILKMS